MPVLSDESKEAAFWGTNDAVDFLDYLEEDHEPIFVRPEVPIIEVSLGVWQQLLRLSKQKRTTPDRLVNRWLKEKLADES